ncbi:MAG: CsgG/HfaB family protein [Acidobacteriota bacterium]
MKHCKFFLALIIGGGLLLAAGEGQVFAQRQTSSSPANDMRSNQPKKGKIKVAIIPQDNQRGWTKDIMVAELETALTGGRFDILSRDSLNSIIAEQKLANSDLADPNNAIKVGRLGSAQYIIVAKCVSVEVKEGGINIGGFGRREKKMTSKVNMQLINAETGSVIKSENYDASDTTASTRVGSFGGNTADAPGQESFTKMMKTFAQRFAEVVSLEVPFETTVAMVRDGQVIIRSGAADGVQEGIQLDVILEGEPIRDADGTILERITNRVATLRAAKVSEKVTYCDVVQTFDPNSKVPDSIPNLGRIQTDMTVRQVARIAPQPPRRNR